MDLAINIPVNIPQGNESASISFTELKEKIQSYVNSLYSHVSVSTTTEHKLAEKKYSERIQRLRAMSHSSAINEDDIMQDDRLAYLLSK